MRSARKRKEVSDDVETDPNDLAPQNVADVSADTGFEAMGYMPSSAHFKLGNALWNVSIDSKVRIVI
jgi:hypothetical protein